MSFSENYQAFLEKINTRLPIKWLTGPMDKKFPLTSLFVFLAIIAIVLVLIFANPFAGGHTQAQYVPVVVKVADEKGNILKNFEFKVRDELTNEEKEYFTDNSGKKEISLIKGGSYTFVVEKKGYMLFSETINTEESEFKAILKIFELPTSSTKTLSFVDSKTREPIKDSLDLVLKCEKGKIIDPSALKVQNGEYTIDVPNDCGSLVATVKNDNYFASGVLIPPTQTVVDVSKLAPITETGTANITVKFGEAYIDDILVKLFNKDDQITPIKSTNTTWSLAKFKDIPVGDYRVVASDPTNKYLSASVDITIIKNATLEKTLNLLAVNPGTGLTVGGDNNTTVETRTIQALLKDESGSDVNATGAKVVLLLDCNSMQDQRTVSQGISFVVDKTKNYCLRGEAEGYIPDVKTVTPGIDKYTFSLVKKTVSNVSNISIRVIDEEGLPVAGAKLLLYDGVTGYIDTRFNSELTDTNGKANFTEIPKGSFFVKVKKVYLEGNSPKFNHLPPNDTNLNITVTVGQGTIELFIKNKQGDAVPEAEIKIYTENNSILGSDFATSAGIYSKKIKADKRIYIVITKDGYIPYFTELFPIYKDKVVTKNVVLNIDNCISDVPCTEYLGVFTPEGEATTKLQNNKVYNLKFIITNGANSNTMGFVLKVGKKDKTIDDIVYIKPVTTNNSVALYYENSPFVTAVAEGTNSKLVDVLFSPTEKGTYELTIPIQVHDAKDQDMIPIYYRGYYAPVDYLDNTKFSKEEYYIGVEELCSQVFCFSGQYVDIVNDLRYDIKSDIRIPMLINSEYKLEYKIKNAKSTSYDGARLKIFNADSEAYPTDRVNIMSYSVVGSFNDVQQNSSGLNYKIPFIGDELTSSQISAYAETSFVENIIPLTVDNTLLKHQIIANQKEIYNLNLNLQSKNLYTMNITYEPTHVLPDNEFDMLITLKDDKLKPVDNASINIYSLIDGYETTIYIDRYTDSSGKVNLKIPPLVVGELLIIEAQKPNYLANKQEIYIDANIIKILYNNSLVTPSSPVIVNINKNKQNGDTQAIEILNITEYDLVLNEFKPEDISFNYSNLLDLGQTLTYLNSQISVGGEFVIKAGEKRELRIKITPGADSMNLVENQEILGSITGHVSKGTSRYPFNVPIKTTVSIGKGVATDNCLVAMGVPNPWITTINSGGSQAIAFTIQNNCRTFEDPDKPLKLNNIKVKMVSEGDKYGYYDLMINTNTTRLGEGVYKVVITDVEPDHPYAATLTYSAGGTKFGNVKTKIYLNGQVETETGLVYVNNGEGENFLSTQITIMEISDCFNIVDSNSNKEIGEAGMFVFDQELKRGLDTKELIIKNTCSDKGRFRVTLSSGTRESSEGIHYNNCDEIPSTGDCQLNFSTGDTEKTIPITKPEVPGAYTIEIKIESINDNDRAVATIYRPLKVNVKDVLYMEDPFFEVHMDPDTKMYTTEPAVLYKKLDLEMTPWHYATNYPGVDSTNTIYDYDDRYVQKLTNDVNVELYNSSNRYVQANCGDGNGFSKFMVTDFDKNRTMFLQNVCFLNLDNAYHTNYNQENMAQFDEWTWVDYVTLGGGMLVKQITKSLTNDYQIFKYHNIPTMNENYLPENEQTKVVDLYDLTNSDMNELIDVMDITGMRYVTFRNNYISIIGKLVSKQTFTNEIPKCIDNHYTPYAPKPYLLLRGSQIATTDDGCGAINVGEDDDSYNWEVGCSGAWPTRNRVDLKYDAYTLCMLDSSIWPEQSGLKPIKFNFKDQANTTFATSDAYSNYKIIRFYPTYDDTIKTQDPAFEGAFPIEKDGRFRFGFYPEKKKEVPNPDLNVYACQTDSDKVGITGPGAVPRINLDWDWKDMQTPSVDACEDTFCDATQLSQVILNRVYAADQILRKNTISCPKSTTQVIEEGLAGTYTYTATPDGVTNRIPAGKVGIQNVSFFTDNDLFKVKVTLQNRTTALQTGSLVIQFANQPITTIEYIDPTTGSTTIEPIGYVGPYSKDVTLQSGTDDTSEYTYTFTNIESNKEPLSINYVGVNSEYEIFDSNITLGNYQPTTTGCTVPATTQQVNGVDYIDMWFNKQQYPKNVLSEWDQSDISALKSSISFNAYLITDNYNQNFQDAFDKAYNGKASVDQGLGTTGFLVSPEPYASGYLSPLFKDNLDFTLKYSLNNEGVQIKTPGLYNVRIDLIFNNKDWKFITSGDKIDAIAQVTFTYLKAPSDNSIFYRLPFDGLVGYTTQGYNRQNYGVSYLGDDVLISKTSTNSLRTYVDEGSNPIKYLNISLVEDVFKLNSEVESRGSVLSIKNDSVDQVNMIFSPSNPTPVLMRIENSKMKPFTLYYQLVDTRKSAPVFGGVNLTRWSGVGDGCDYSGDYIYSAFNNTLDAMTTPDERMYESYKVDWPIVNSGGNIYLRSIFYTPVAGVYSLNIKSSEGTLSSTGKDFRSTLKIPTNDSITMESIKDVFDNIENNNICVTNSPDGTYSEFFWNPVAIYNNNENYMIGPEDRLKCN